MSTSVTCIVITSFAVVPVDLGKQPHKVRKISSGFISLSVAHAACASAAQQRS
jgi:hypothetical protein